MSEQRAQIWKIIHFYERLFVVVENKLIRRKLVPELFGEHFYWWYLNCFEAKLIPLDYRSSAIRIKKLKAWFDKHAKSDDKARWLARERQTSNTSSALVIG